MNLSSKHNKNRQKGIGFRLNRWFGTGVCPDFLILGGQKCGTTSLFASLMQHPNIHRPRKKEPNFFSYRSDRNLRWYRSNFPSVFTKNLHKICGRPFQTFEASTNYLFHPLTPERVRSALPEAKLIALLREPASRAYSHYQFMRRLGSETLSFEEALAAEDGRLAGSVVRIRNDPNYDAHNFLTFSYKTRGRYAEQLEAWTKHFPRKQLLVLQTEAYFRDPKSVVERVLGFLGLPRSERMGHEMQNVGGYKEPMNDATREQLRLYFKPHNERLWKWLGEEWDWA